MLTTGATIQNRYRIVALLGQGGMGAVYRAWDTRLNIPIALKEMVPQAELAPQTLNQLRQQFRQEASVLAHLSHPHLVRVTDFFEEGGNIYLVMDLVQGENLADIIAQHGPLPEADALAWGGQLLDALAYCHAHGVIHRDIKPQNVIIRPDGQAMLVDFGLVKLWDPSDPRTKTVMRGMGTPEYAPPEQYESDAGHTDPRSDIYSVGATLYHALTGQAPPTATLRIADPGQFKPLRSLRPNVTPQTETTILKAMELPRSQRWQSAQEMAQALRAPTAVQQRPVVQERYEKTRVLPGAQQPAPAPIPTPTTAPRKRRIPVWFWAGGALALLLLCGAILILGGAAIHQAGVAATAQAEATNEAITQAQATAIAQQFAHATATAQVDQATATARAQATATAEASADATLTAATQWPLVFSDSFDVAGNGWTVGDYDDELLTGSRSIAGKYRWQATASGSVVWWSIPDVDTISDFYLAADGQQVGGNGNAQYGLLFRRLDSDNYYVFRIRDGGDYQFRVRYAGEWDTLIDWTGSPLIQPGKANRLAVIAEGEVFTFYINGQYASQYTDDKLSTGQVALVIGLDEGDTATIEFDDFEMRSPEAISLWPLTFQDSFETNENDWSSGDYEDERISGNRSVSGGKYRWEANALDGVVWWAISDAQPASDLDLTVEVRRISGPEDSRYGLVLKRADAGTYGLFLAKDSGLFKFSVRYQQDWHTVIDWTKSTAIVSGGVNRLRVVAEGSHYTFYINGQLAGEADDSHLSSGQTGVAIELDKGDEATFEFDNFAVRTP